MGRTYKCEAFPALRVGHLEFSGGVLTVEDPSDIKLVERSAMFGAFIFPVAEPAGDPGSASDFSGHPPTIPPKVEILKDEEVHTTPTPFLKVAASEAGATLPKKAGRGAALKEIAKKEVLG